MSETPDRDDESDVVDDSDSTLLYDILVYREWPPNPDSAFDTKASDTLQSLDLGLFLETTKFLISLEAKVFPHSSK